MDKVKCVRCGQEVIIDIAKAKDSEGEVFECPYCSLKFRYTKK